MSRYLVDRIERAANVEVVTRAQVTALEGEGRHARGDPLAPATGRPKTSGATIRHLFLFIGAQPNTDWLAGSGIALDAKGFVLTGSGCRRRAHAGDEPRAASSPSATCAPGSVKRVAAAVGEGAQVVAALHGFLAGARPTTAIKRT